MIFETSIDNRHVIFIFRSSIFHQGIKFSFSGPELWLCMDLHAEPQCTSFDRSRTIIHFKQNWHVYTFFIFQVSWYMYKYFKNIFFREISFCCLMLRPAYWYYVWTEEMTYWMYLLSCNAQSTWSNLFHNFTWYCKFSMN